VTHAHTGRYIQSKKGRLFRRRNDRLDCAAYGRIEALERRVLLSSATIVVNENYDSLTYSTPMGSSSPYEAVTLRDAVKFADNEFASNSAASFTITFAGSVTGTVSVLEADGGELEIKANNTLIERGANASAISGCNSTTVFKVDSGYTAEIADLTITDGQAYSGDGGDILNDGGTLTLTTCTLVGATSGDTVVASATNGGGIFNSGQLTMTGSTVTSCQVSDEGDGGGIYNAGTAVIDGDTITENGAKEGGGIFDAVASTLTLTDGTVTFNKALDFGGGIKNDGTATLTSCNVNDNMASLSSLSGTTETTGGGGGGLTCGVKAQLDVVGCVIEGDSAAEGGGIRAYGGYVTVTDCTIEGDSATAGNGGGIDVVAGSYTGLLGQHGYLNVYSSDVSYDTASSGSSGGGIFIAGLDTPTHIENCVINGDQAGYAGGGIVIAFGGAVYLNYCTVSGDSAFGDSSSSYNGDGGGIFIESSRLYASYSTVSENYAAAEGGGICLVGSVAGAVNCTIAENSAVTDGGGISVLEETTAFLHECTISGDNSAPTGGGVYLRPGTFGTSGYMDLFNSIIAGNYGATPTSPSDVSGTLGITDESPLYNVIGTGGSGGLVDSDGNQVNVTVSELALAPLGDFGGSTQTMPPLAGSHVLNAGDGDAGSVAYGSGELPTKDQRGVSRPSGTIDVGAVQGTVAVLTVNTNSDNNPSSPLLSLREAINDAADESTDTIITFNPSDFTGGAANVINLSETLGSLNISTSEHVFLDIPSTGLTVNGASGPTFVNDGRLMIEGGSADDPLVVGNSADSEITGSGLLVVGASKPSYLLLESDSGGSSTQGALEISPLSTLDITNNTFIVNFGTFDPASTIRRYLTGGYNVGGAKWTGTGITSSTAAANPAAFSIGYADGGTAADRANTGVTSGTVEIKYTVAGDANLSGSVDLSDLVIVASDFGDSGADWAEGDVNYSSTVDLSDLVIVASNFGSSLSSTDLIDSEFSDPVLTIYVDASATGSDNGSSWANAYTSLQSALSSAASIETSTPGTIIDIDVAQGTYYPTSGTNRSATFQLLDDVAIYGGYAGDGTSDPGARDSTLYPTILSGDIGTLGFAGDNSYAVVTGSGTNSTASLDGVTIEYGGNGVYDYDGSPTIFNCTFSQCSGYYGGGMFNYDSSPTLTNCVFSECSAYEGGGIYNEFGEPTLTNCVFSNDTASAGGGGMYSLDGTQILAHCTFIDDSAPLGGAIDSPEASDQFITDCTFDGDSATTDGGAIYSGFYSYLAVINGEFTGDSVTGSGSDGGAIFLGEGAYTCTYSSTFTDNSAPGSGHGGAIYGDDSRTPNVANCIFWNDSGGEIGASNSRATAVVVDSDVDGGYTGTGNMNNNPLFVRSPNLGSGDYGDLDLQSNSPCINAGSNTYLDYFGITSDSAGNGRVIASIVDMGALEAQGSTLPAASLTVNHTGSAVSGLTLTFNEAISAGTMTLYNPDGTTVALDFDISGDTYTVSFTSFSTLPAGQYVLAVDPYAGSLSGGTEYFVFDSA
jgi:predicted outer membrane repeat protein